MDYYFSADDDTDALRAKELPGGPMPGSNGFDSIEAKGVFACPHLEQLVSVASNKSGPSLVPQLKTLWPEPPANFEDFEPGPSLMRLPDCLRDDLAEVELTGAVAAQWADELFGYETGDAERFASGIIDLARAAKAGNRSLYWWSEM